MDSKFQGQCGFEAPIPSTIPIFDARQEPGKVRSIELELPDDRLSVMEHELPVKVYGASGVDGFTEKGNG